MDTPLLHITHCVNTRLPFPAAHIKSHGTFGFPDQAAKPKRPYTAGVYRRALGQSRSRRTPSARLARDSAARSLESRNDVSPDPCGRSSHLPADLSEMHAHLTGLRLVTVLEPITRLKSIAVA